MSATRRPFSRLSNIWMVGGSSIAILVLLGVLLWSPWSRRGIYAAEPLLFYCAEGMTKPVAQIVKEYKSEFGVSVHVTYDGSGSLLSTMTAAQGKGDLYLAADTSHMLKAQKPKVGAPLVAESIPVAIMRPVLVVSKKTQGALKKKVVGLSDLERGDLKVIVARPELASIGELTQKVLEPLGIWSKLQGVDKARVTEVKTVNQVALNVYVVANSIGIVWDAVALEDPNLEIVPTPELAEVRDQMLIGVLANSKQPRAALHFARYLTARDKGLEIFRKHHFTPVPDADQWAETPEIQLYAGLMLIPGIQRALKSFERREGATVLTNPNGCGVLTSTMQGIKRGDKSKGRFPDAFFSCDDYFMDQVMHWFDPKSRAVLTRNDVVIAVPKGNPKRIASLEDLKRTDLRKIGLAHPTKSALGKLSIKLLERQGFTEKDYDPEWNERIRHSPAGDTLVMQIRSYDAALVYRSNALIALSNDRELCEIIEIEGGKQLASQPFAIANETQHPYLVKRLLQAIIRDADHFRDLGFTWVYKES
jgi:molybdate transport system substrate-binding protein